mgnify:CR=1 FL=1
MPDSPTARARIDWGDLARREPFDRDFGGGRGRPIDRHYIDAFLDANRGAIRGHVLEVGDDHYARRFGGAQVHAVDVVDHVQTPNTTIFGDLSDSVTLPPARFDCIICTQTLHLLFDVHATLANLHRALVVGGVLLVTVPGISQIVRYDMARWGDFWRFTTYGLETLLRDAGFEVVRIDARGGLFTFLGHQLSLPIVGLTLGIPVLGRLIYHVVAISVVRPSLFLDRVLPGSAKFAAGYAVVARRRDGSAPRAPGCRSSARTRAVAGI